jgi:hypothetical protein
MKTYTGTVVRASHDTQTPNVTLRVQPVVGGHERDVTLHCGTRVAVEAACLIGRKVHFQAELSERTSCLTNVQLCVRSEYGIRAVKDGERPDAPRNLQPGSVSAFWP